MLLGDIKAEALKIMGLPGAMNVSYLDVGPLKNDPTYALYLYAMPGAINRAIDRFVVKEVIVRPKEYVTINTPETKDFNELGIDDMLCRMLPYFIVGEIYSNDEPVIAANNRNTFEGLLEEYAEHIRERQEQVEVIYREVL